MPDRTDVPVPPQPHTSPPRGPVQYAWFAGLLEGRCNDSDELRRIAGEINGLGAVHIDLELDAGRFSALLDERTIAGESMTQETQDRLLGLLQEMVDASSDPQAVASTMRCTAVHGDSVVETLFAPMRGAMKCVNRVRPVQREDREHEPAGHTGSAIAGFGIRRVVLIGILMLVAFSALTWQSGLLDRVMSADVELLQVDSGPFGELLAVDVEPNWGNYRVLLRRGAAYPTTAAGVKELEAAAATPADRAAVLAVCDGGNIYLRLSDEQGKTLAYHPVEMRALLLKNDAVISGHLPGRIAARSIQLALEAGESGR